jgi:hypothetical protein
MKSTYWGECVRGYDAAQQQQQIMAHKWHTSVSKFTQIM